MKNGNARFRGFGRFLTMLVILCGVLLLTTMPATAQDFPGDIVGAGELPPILSGPYRIQVGDVLDVQLSLTHPDLHFAFAAVGPEVVGHGRDADLLRLWRLRADARLLGGF